MAVRRKKMKRSAEYHTRRANSGVEEDGYRGKSLIIYLPLYRPQCLIIYRPKKSTCILPLIPNHLSTYQLHYFYYSLFGEYDGAGGVEMRGLEAVWRGACRGAL